MSDGNHVESVDPVTCGSFWALLAFENVYSASELPVIYTDRFIS